MTIVEFALTFLLFIFLVCAIFDFGHLFFAAMDAQYALQEAARYGSTGNHLPDPTNPASTLSRVNSIISTLNNDNIVSAAHITNIQISSLNGGSGSAGGPKDMLTITATVSVPLITPIIAQLFPNGQYTYTASITVQNEPFLASQTK